MKPFTGSLQRRKTQLKAITTFHQKQNPVSMDGKTSLTEKEKALIAIAHEIRNPLTAIKMSNQLMQESMENERVDKLSLHSFAMIIADNIMRIETHLKELLSYKPRPIVLKPVNISSCLDKAVDQLKDRLFLSGVELHKNYGGSHWLGGDTDTLTTAFVNIIANAIEAINGDKGKIWINLHEANDSIRITIKDNGVGMDSNTASHMFDPYFSDKSDGLGIGLFHVKEIMNLHRANIVADSLPGVGTSISILFNSLPAEQVRHTSKGSTRTSSL